MPSLQQSACTVQAAPHAQAPLAEQGRRGRQQAKAGAGLVGAARLRVYRDRVAEVLARLAVLGARHERPDQRAVLLPPRAVACRPRRCLRAARQRRLPLRAA